jgi:hypothetical protein
MRLSDWVLLVFQISENMLMLVEGCFDHVYIKSTSVIGKKMLIIPEIMIRASLLGISAVFIMGYSTASLQIPSFFVYVCTFFLCLCLHFVKFVAYLWYQT